MKSVKIKELVFLGNVNLISKLVIKQDVTGFFMVCGELRTDEEFELECFRGNLRYFKKLDAAFMSLKEVKFNGAIELIRSEFY